jgi:hypothetical protein
MMPDASVPKRPGRTVFWRLCRHQHHRARGIAARQPDEQTQRHQLPDIAGHPHQRDRHRHAQAGAHQHQLAPVDIAKPAPQRRHEGGGKEGGAIGDPRPLHDRRMVADPEFLDIERQERKQQRHGDNGRERADERYGKIALPVDRAGFGSVSGGIPFRIGHFEAFTSVCTALPERHGRGHRDRGRPIANLSGNGKVRRRRVWLPVGHALV